LIIVTVDLKSAISESRDKRLATLHISNIGGGKTRRNYSVQTFGGSGRPGKSGEVHDYPAEAVAVLNLVRRAIEAAGYTR
jgi:hypothetical protein